MMDLSRAFAEKRRFIVPIAVAFVVNLLIYAVVIYPRTSSAGALEHRAQQAAMARARAAADLRDAEAMRTGQERAAQQLTRFYDSVLPKGQDGARRITYRRLATLADESNLDYDRRTIAIKQDRESALEQMDVTMVLEGEYRDVRRFIHKLETAPEFVVIEDVGLVQDEKNAPLTLTVRLSTYYKAGS
jgi:Tfp pilus assembly protein PilO